MNVKLSPGSQAVSGQTHVPAGGYLLMHGTVCGSLWWYAHFAKGVHLSSFAVQQHCVTTSIQVEGLCSMVSGVEELVAKAERHCTAMQVTRLSLFTALCFSDLCCKR